MRRQPSLLVSMLTTDQGVYMYHNCWKYYTMQNSNDYWYILHDVNAQLNFLAEEHAELMLQTVHCVQQGTFIKR